jgi:hypothetical protein
VMFSLSKTSKLSLWSTQHVTQSVLGAVPVGKAAET